MLKIEIPRAEQARFLRAIEEMQTRKLREIGELIERTARSAERTARELAPRGATGDLKRSIKMRLLQEADQVIGAEVYADRSVAFYAAMVEYGASTKAARPFLTPAMEAHRVEFLRELKQILKRP